MARKKTFPCGHRGKGNSCSRCAATEQSAEASKEATSTGDDDAAESDEDDKEKWRASFEDDPIDLHLLPNKNLVKRARMILDEVGKGAPWHQFNGKRLQHDRNVISVPLGRRYRILFRTDNGAPQPVQVLSHEAYNGTKPGRR
ncbi:MAG: hypothetical protein KC457_13820 [Myxococcales bacterium]|nr:hypothetical protein [Myxococcales bacterium]